MSIPKAIVDAYLATPMTAQLRLAGEHVPGSDRPVSWTVGDDGRGQTLVSWKLAKYERFDEAVVVSGGEVVVRYREGQTLALPPGAVYEAEFVFVVDEG